MQSFTVPLSVQRGQYYLILHCELHRHDVPNLKHVIALLQSLWTRMRQLIASGVFTRASRIYRDLLEVVFQLE